MQRLGVVPAATNRQVLPLSRFAVACQGDSGDRGRRYWQHGALDYMASSGAVQNLSKGDTVQGASTMTQGLPRNLYIGHP